MEQVSEFQAWLLAHGRSQATANAYASDIRKWERWVEDNPPPRANPGYGHSTTEFITAMRVEARPHGSILRYMSAIRSYYEFQLLTDPNTTEPFIGYKGPKPQRAQAHPLPGMMVDVDSMVKAAWRPHHKLLIGLCGYAGLRVSEARSITPRSLMKDHQNHWWLTVHGKGGVYREVPVSDALYALLLDAPEPATPSTPYVDIADRTARKAITEIAKRAHISRGVSSHDLRHTFGSEIYGKTKDLRVTQELLGHASSSTTEGYTGIAAKEKREAVMGVLG